MSKILLLVGMSGCGKSTLMKNLKERWPEKYELVISTTTREKREGEVTGVDYDFINIKFWDTFLENNSLIVQKTKFAGNWYATFRSDYDNGEKISVLAVVPEQIEVIRKAFPDRDIRHLFFNVSDDLLRRHLSKLPKEQVEERIARGKIKEDYMKIYMGKIPNDACWVGDCDVNEKLPEFVNSFMGLKI